jgi:hypothetical protein
MDGTRPLSDGRKSHTECRFPRTFFNVSLESTCFDVDVTKVGIRMDGWMEKDVDLDTA